MAKLRMVGGDFILAAAMAWRILAKAVGHINDAKCLELVANCRAVNVSYPSIPHSKRSFAYRPDLGIPNGKADGLHLGIEKLRLKV